MSVIGIIPARYASSRFPGKMLASIFDKTLLQRTYESAQKATLLDQLVVATDDSRIKEHVEGFGGRAYLTSKECLNGTERLADAIKKYPELGSGSIYICIQGDRPCLSAEMIDDLVIALQKAPQDVMATPIVKTYDIEEIQSLGAVKCVVDAEGYILYFSRSVIPYSKKIESAYKHVGIYAFRRDFLLQYVNLPNTPCQLQEDLEQLKVLEHGFRIKAVEVDDCDLSVDYPEDIFKVEQWLCRQNTSLSQVASSPH